MALEKDNTESIDPLVLLGNLEKVIDVEIEKIRVKLTDVLREIEGIEFPTFAEKRAIARKINYLLHLTSCKIKCPKKECGKPALLRAVLAGNSIEGVFQFDHYIDKKRTTHGGKAILPVLELALMDE